MCVKRIWILLSAPLFMKDIHECILGINDTNTVESKIITMLKLGKVLKQQKVLKIQRYKSVKSRISITRTNI